MGVGLALEEMGTHIEIERDREDCELLSPLALWAGSEKITQFSHHTGARHMSI